MNDFDPIEMMAAAAEDTNPADLKDVKRLAARLIKIDDEIEQCENYIARAKKEREDIRVRILPNVMFELGIDSVTIDNHHCKLEPMVQATLPKEPEARLDAVNWLVANGHGGVVKRELKVDLPKGDGYTEFAVKEAVQEAAPGLNVSTYYNVHHSTYSALIRQLVREGAPIPTDVLGVFIGQIVRVDKD